MTTGDRNEGSAGEAVERAARIVLRPIANPLPLGFLALAGATLVVSGLQLGWLDKGDGNDVALILVAFAFPLQLVAAVLGYLARDVAAGTGMGLLSGTWLATGLIELTSAPGSTSDALGLLLLLVGAALAIVVAGAASAKLLPAAVLGTAAARIAATGVYELGGSGTWQDVAGVVGLVLCALALYAALGLGLEDVRHATVLPLARRGSGRESAEGSFSDQLQRIEREAGVREQL